MWSCDGETECGSYLNRFVFRFMTRIPNLEAPRARQAIGDNHGGVVKAGTNHFSPSG
jgi:hypothetical protein